MDAAAFADLVHETCRVLGLTSIAASAGVSYGGMQAVHVASRPGIRAGCLVLHSCAPSALPYPDTRAESLAGPVVFAPDVEAATWWLVRRMVGTESGLRFMLGQLSTLPASQW
ncbi:hypothetical protein GCM10009715_19050 [Paeniglutamicibacter psychrophenolicus]